MASVHDKFDLNLLPIALAIYDELSVSRAARRLGMSQPAVSMALRKMRTAFNDPMFIRTAGGIAPTPRAHALVRVARPLFTSVQETLLADENFNPHLTSRPFVFALSDVGEMVFVPRLPVYFARLSPDLAVARPPFDIGGFDVKQHWHRRFHGDSRSKWMRKQVTQLFNDDTDEWRVE